MPDEEKSSNDGSEQESEKQTPERKSRFFKGKASRTGEEGVFLQPTGSPETDPFVDPPTQPEASDQSESPGSESGPTPTGEDATAPPPGSNDGKSDSE